MIEAHPVPNAQARAYLDSLPSRPPFQQRDIADLRRELSDECLATSGQPEPVASVEDVLAGGVPSRLYRPVGGERDVLVWLHGGAWMLGDLDCFDAVVRALANRAGCAVLSVDYRLAPEHPYPAAIDDCWAVTEWAAERFDQVAVGGDSAGGNLSAAVALRARDRGVELALQLLVYPVLDWEAVDTTFYNEFRERYVEFVGLPEFGAERQDGIRRIWENYIPDPSRRTEPDASPLRAASFEGVASALVITADHDILRGEGEDYARQLARAGVSVDLVNYEGQIHGFFHMLGVMEDAHAAVDTSAAALRQAFAA